MSRVVCLPRVNHQSSRVRAEEPLVQDQRVYLCSGGVMVSQSVLTEVMSWTVQSVVLVSSDVSQVSVWPAPSCVMVQLTVRTGLMRTCVVPRASSSVQ